jgi:Flp pilus assembly protein TadG
MSAQAILRGIVPRPAGAGRRGQSLVEFALVVPVLAIILTSILEFGLAFDTNLMLEAAARQGSRVGAEMGNYGDRGICPNTPAATNVDPSIVTAVQASLTNAGVTLTSVQIRIFLPDADGNSTSSYNTWVWSTSPTGHFTETYHSWDACGRHDGTFGGGIYDSIGVRVTYTYTSVTGILGFFTGGLPMTATAIMPIGPPWSYQ